MHATRWLTPLLLAVAVLPGCASYTRQLGQDLAQSVHVGLSASAWPGLYVYGQAPVIATSLGYVGEAYAVGSDYGYTNVWRLAARGVVVGGENVRSEWAWSLADFGQRWLPEVYLYQTHFLLLNLVIIDRRTQAVPNSIALTKVEAGFHALFVGASVGVDVLELLDAVAAVFGLDLVGDRDFVPSRYQPPEDAVP